MKKYFLPVLLILASTILFGQNFIRTDTLLISLAKSKNDTNKVQTLYRLAFYYEMNNVDSAKYYLKKTKTLADSLNYDGGRYLYYERSAVVAYTGGNYTDAMEYSNKGLAIARKLKDSSYVSTMLNNLAITYGFLQKLKEQLDYTLQVKNIVEAIKDSAKLSPLYHNLSNCYNDLGQYRKSADCALFSIRLYKEFKKRNDYINRVYGSLAIAYQNLKMSDSAIYYYDIATKESLIHNDKYAAVVLYMQQCDIYAGLKQFDKMQKIAEQSLPIAQELQSSPILASSLYNLAASNFYNGNNKEATKRINEALAIAKKDSLVNEMQNSYDLLTYIAVREGNFSLAIDAKQIADSIKTAALNDQIVKSTAEMEKKYETEKKDNQILLQQAQLTKRKLVIYLLIAAAIILLTIFFFAYRYTNQKQKLQQQRISELEIQQQLTATEAVLKGEEQERTRLAKDLHDGLGGMLSGIKYSMNTMKGNLVMTNENSLAFERSMDMLDSSIKEMRRVAHNMMPEALVKFGLDTALKDFCNDINQSGALKSKLPVNRNGADKY